MSPLEFFLLPPYQPGPPLPLTGASLKPLATGGGGGTQEASSSAPFTLALSVPTWPMSSRRLGRSTEALEDRARETDEWEGRLKGSEKARFDRSSPTSLVGDVGGARESDNRERSDRLWCEMTRGRVGGRGGAVAVLTRVSELFMPDGDR